MLRGGHHHRITIYFSLVLASCMFITWSKIDAYQDIYRDDKFQKFPTGDKHLWRPNPSSAEILSRSFFHAPENKGDFRLKSQRFRDKPSSNRTSELQYDQTKEEKKSSIALHQNLVEIQCPPCEKVHCSPRKPRHLKCRGGLVRGVCGCCPVCAKQLDETCGGHWNFLGTCDRGLICESDESVHLDHRISFDDQRPHSRQKGRISSAADEEIRRRLKPVGIESSGRSTSKLSTISDVGRTRKETKGWSPEGRCVPGYELNDSPLVVKCRPKCTLDFCLENPREICSAADNAEERRSCSGSCHHTSCSACRLLKNAPECPGCSMEDFDCIRRFGKCLKQEICSRNYHPCRSMRSRQSPFISNKADARYTFKCLTPSCLQ